MQTIMNARVARPVAVALLVLALGAGCASETKTVRRETTQYPTTSTENPPRPVAEQQTIETTTETKKEPDGVITSGVKLVGSVVAFPFRVIGAAFGALF